MFIILNDAFEYVKNIGFHIFDSQISCTKLDDKKIQKSIIVTVFCENWLEFSSRILPFSPFSAIVSCSYKPMIICKLVNNFTRIFPKKSSKSYKLSNEKNFKNADFSVSI